MAEDELAEVPSTLATSLKPGRPLTPWPASELGQTRPKLALPDLIRSRAQQSCQRDYKTLGAGFRLLANSCQLVEQRLGVLQIGGLEALGEPAVDRREKAVGRGASALLGPETGEAGRGTQL
jgi:hypothetical protein